MISIGSEVASRNPPWTRDELILALDLYFDENPSHISKTHRKVVELSELLNKLSIHPDRPDAVRFRNPNGVYMKLCNFLRFDPSYSGSGLTRGGKLEEEIWNELAEDQSRLRKLAQTIKENVEYSETHETILEVDEEAEAPEGRVLFRVHRTRERNPALVKKRKQAALKKSGFLRCEVCGFDFQKVYGDLGKSFIECHHTVPVSELKPGARTRLKDLALVCANCHRMLHRGGETLTIKVLRKILR